MHVSCAPAATSIGGQKMRQIYLLAAAAVIAISTPAFAKPKPTPPQPKPLHGFCALGAPCPENISGTNSPTSVNPPVFGFADSGGASTGTIFIDILIPDNVAAGPFTISNYTSSGPLGSPVTANLFNSSPWKTGQLDSYLGISATPTNPIGSYLPVTQGYQPSADGFDVFQADLGILSLIGTSDIGSAGQDDALLKLGQVLPQGSFILAFIKDPNGAYRATANSGAILETGTGLPEPATWAMMLAGFGAIGLSVRRSRKNTLPQLA